MREPATRPSAWIIGGLLALAAWLPGKVSVWIDAEGRAVFSDGDAPREAEAIEAAELAARWRGTWEAEPLVTPSRDRFDRELAAAIDDLRRGEQARGLRELRRLASEQPARPEVHWALARIELSRGRHGAALEALDQVLALASAMPDGWRDRAQALRDRVAAELAHAQTLSPESALRPTPFVQRSESFRLHYDHPFSGRGYGDRVLVSLERIRAGVAQRLGRELSEPLEVRLYTRADYVRDYGHRFGFRTVGFYDGAIHVVADRHPERRLTALLSHEYVHAVFFDALGSHRPFFLNEGLAERMEQQVYGRERLVRGDWRRLVDALREQQWIPLGDLVEAFNRLDPERVPLAYLESRAFVELLEDEWPGGAAGWLERCAAGQDWRAALWAETGQTLAQLDATLRTAVANRFPAASGAISVTRD